MNVGDYHTFQIASYCDVATSWDVTDPYVIQMNTVGTSACEIICVGVGTSRLYAHNTGDTNHKSSDDYAEVTVVSPQQPDSITLYPSTTITVNGSGTTRISAFTDSGAEVYVDSYPSNLYIDINTVSHDAYYKITIFTFKGRYAGNYGYGTITFKCDAYGDYTGATLNGTLVKASG